MEIKMICPVCGEKIKVKFPEIEITYIKDGYDDVVDTCETEFECPSCYKHYKVKG